MKIDEKIDKMLEQNSEIKVSLARMSKDVEQNTRDLSYHIKRTDLIEGKLQKMIYLLWIGAGIGLALYGPAAFKLIGLLP